jgi:phosphoglycerate kinase
MNNGRIKNDYQIKVSLPTIKYLQDAGAKVILATHLESKKDSIEPLKSFVPDGVEILENLRDNPGEEGNSEEFAKELATKADIFVNEAFAVSHREHASIVGVPKLLPGFFGLQFVKEVENLSKAFNPMRPFLFILGGAKIETKVPLIEKFLEVADSVFIGGTLAKPVSEMPMGKNPKIFFPSGDISALDVNDETIEILKLKIENSKFILWNGPLGNYEKGFKKGTLALAKIIADSGKESIVGGGDTLSAIEELGILDKFSFVSTGGGAMLEFLAKGTLPGIKALKN